MFVDTHCHLQSTDINCNEEIINTSLNSNIKYLIINSYNIKTSEEAVKLSIKYNNVFVAVGIGPDEVEKEKIEEISKLEKLIQNNKVVALGEIGLDYYHNNKNAQKQQEYFIAQLLLAKKYNLPVIIHCRRAYQDLIKILKEHKIKGSIHCFSGSFEEAQELIKLGYKLGIGGVITFKNEKKLKEIVEKVLLTDILLETDTPYLAPEPYRGKENRPYYLIEIAKKIAEIKNIPIEKVAEITTAIAVQVFDLNSSI